MRIPLTTFSIARPLSAAIRLALPVAALLSAQSAHAELYKSLPNNWSVHKLDNRCTAAAGYEKDQTFLISYYAEQDRVTLSLYIPQATSLKDNDVVELYVKFVVGNTLDDGWGSKTFIVSIEDDGIPALLGGFSGRDMLRDIARADIIAFSLDEEAERNIAVYKLKGTAAVVASLRKCGLEVAGLNPDDPFVK